MENIKVVLKRDFRDKMVNGKLRNVATGTYTCNVNFDNKILVSTKRGTITENDYKLACYCNNLSENTNEFEIKAAKIEFYKGNRPDNTKYYYISIHLYNMFNYATDESVDVIRMIWLNNQELNLLSLKGIKVNFVERSLNENELKEMQNENINAE